MRPGETKPHSPNARGELSPEELDAQAAAELPDREAMTIVSTDPVDPGMGIDWPGAPMPIEKQPVEPQPIEGPPEAM